MVELIDHPTIMREKRSIVEARYSQPSSVQMQVMSEAQTSFGPLVEKSLV